MFDKDIYKIVCLSRIIKNLRGSLKLLVRSRSEVNGTMTKSTNCRIEKNHQNRYTH